MARIYHPPSVRRGLVAGLHLLARHDGLPENCNRCTLAIAQAIEATTGGN